MKSRKDMEKGKARMEIAEPSKQGEAKVRMRRRKVTMDDFQLGEGQEKDNLLTIFWKI